MWKTFHPDAVRVQTASQRLKDPVPFQHAAAAMAVVPAGGTRDPTAAAGQDAGGDEAQTVPEVFDAICDWVPTHSSRFAAADDRLPSRGAAVRAATEETAAVSDR
jgi:hypothetical protein